MNVFETAIVGYVNHLLEERKARPLTHGEESFLIKLDPLMSRIKLRETLHPERVELTGRHGQ